MLVKLTDIEWPTSRLRRVGNYDWLIEDIKHLGQLQAIVLTPIEDPKPEGPTFRLVAGMHRFLARWHGGWEDIEAEVRSWEDVRYEQLAEISENLHRKELEAGEKIKHIALQHRIREQLGLKAKRGQRVTKVEKFSHLETRKEEAQRIGKSDRAVRGYRQIYEGIHPGVFDRLKGTYVYRTHREMQRLSRRTLGEQVFALWQILQAKEEEGKDIGVFEALRRAERWKTARLARQTDAPEGRYRTIVIDPPWAGEDSGDVDPYGKLAPAYPTMPIERLMDMKEEIDRIAEPGDCHLYLWVTPRTLRHGLDLVEHYGFELKTKLVWIKHRPGTGRYFVGQHEDVLFATRGTRHLARAGVPNVFEGKRTSHSTKPEQFYEIVEEVSPGPRIEMFARETRENWHSWGTLERRKEAI